MTGVHETDTNETELSETESSKTGLSRAKRETTRYPPAIAWSIPAVRPGWRGAVDRFFGPGQTRPEIAVQVIGGLLLLAVVAVASAPAVQRLELSGWALLVLAVFAVDGIGGVLTNTTGTAKRWYHRPGTAKERLWFVGAHLVHLGLLAALVVPDSGVWFTVNTVLLLAGALLITLVPLSIRRPTATAATLAAVLVNELVVPMPTGLGWVVLVFYVKLLLAHLVPEAPFADER